MANRRFTQFPMSLHNKLVILDCNFVVDSTNGNGFGVRNLKGPGIANVYMNTSASFAGNTHTNNVIDGISGGTASLVVGMRISGSGIAAGTLITSITSGTAITVSPATTATASAVTINYSAVGSPTTTGPAAGLIYVNFQDNYNRYYFGSSGFVSPVSGTPISISTGSSLTVGNVYTIVSVGTTTTAQWVAVGLAIGTTPAIGVSFVANATSGSGTGIVEASATAGSGITNIEVVGDPNTTITSSAATIIGQTSGSYMVLQCFASGTRTAPAAGSVCGLSFFFSNSLITVKGE